LWARRTTSRIFSFSRSASSAVRSALGFDQRLHLRIVDAPELSLVEEVLHFGVVVDEAEAIHVEPEFVHVRAAVVHDDLVGIRRAGVCRPDPGHTDIVDHLGAVVDDVVDDRFDGQRGGVEFG
jgi:hypothetical protein